MKHLEKGFLVRVKNASFEWAKQMAKHLSERHDGAHVIVVDSDTGMKLADSKAVAS